MEDTKKDGIRRTLCKEKDGSFVIDEYSDLLDNKKITRSINISLKSIKMENK